MNQKLLGAMRAIGYPILFYAISTIISNLGASGVVDLTTATLITGILGILEHTLALYLGYNLPSSQA